MAKFVSSADALSGAILNIPNKYLQALDLQQSMQSAMNCQLAGQAAAAAAVVSSANNSLMASTSYCTNRNQPAFITASYFMPNNQTAHSSLPPPPMAHASTAAILAASATPYPSYASSLALGGGGGNNMSTLSSSSASTSNSCRSSSSSGGHSSSNLHGSSNYHAGNSMSGSFMSRVRKQQAVQPHQHHRNTASAHKGPYPRQTIPIMPSTGGRYGPRGRRVVLREEDYEVFIPKKSTSCKDFNAKVHCRGCNKEFMGSFVSNGQVFGEPGFFFHCTRECVKYKSLGLIRKCDQCALLFINSQSERKHHGEVHSRVERIIKPDWMSSQVYRVRSGIRCNTKVSCSACGKFFGAQNSRGKISYSLEYLIHCIEKCVEYQKLGLVQTCPICNCKFLNRLSLSQHKLKSKH